MDRATGIDLCVAWLAFVAASAICGGLLGAALRLTGWARDRRGLRRLEAFANHPGTRRLLDDIHNQPREEDR